MSNVRPHIEAVTEPADWPVAPSISYLGGKSRFLDSVCPVLLAAGTRRVVDLFAGTGSVGYAVRKRTEVAANDVQRYAYVLNEALLNGCKMTQPQVESFFAQASLIESSLVDGLASSINAEEQQFARADWKSYSEFCTNTPSVVAPNVGDHQFEDLRAMCGQVLRDRVAHHQPGRPTLFSTFYPNTYFGLRQCVEIDALRGAADTLDDPSQKMVLLSALMNAMSTAVSATTHFAQYLKPNGPVTTSHLMAKRQLSLFDLTRSSLGVFESVGLLDAQHPRSIVGNADYLEFLNRVALDAETTVYADPPYFKEHYSRYYHVLETLCLYDYPEITFNPRLNAHTVGRYRDDRFVSPFGRKSQALKAFGDLGVRCARSSSRLVISYSDNSIVGIEDISDTLSDDFSVEVLLTKAKHSTQGRKSMKDVNECLLVCTPRARSTYPSASGGFEKMRRSLENLQPDFTSPAGGLHTYAARKQSNVLAHVIESLLAQPGTVLDPFAGSGSTLIEAKRLGHKAIGVDISQLSALTVDAALTPWDAQSVRAKLDAFLERLETTHADLYRVDVQGEPRVIERCHFDRQPDGALTPTHYRYFNIGEDGKLGPRRLATCDDSFCRQYAEVAASAAPSFATLSLMPNSRIAIPVGATVADFFCARNRVFVDGALAEARSMSEHGIDPVLQLLISSAVSLLRLSDKKASTALPFWMPKDDVTSRNGLIALRNRAKQMVDALEYLESQYSQDSVTTGFRFFKKPLQLVSQTELPDESVDLVVTDPPYTDQVPYLEYAQIQALLLGWDSMNPDVLRQEIVVSDATGRPDKTREAFAAQLAIAFHRISRAMKQDAHLVVFFHDFSLAAWSGLMAAAHDAGLAYEGQVSVNRTRRSFKSILSPLRTLNGEYVILFRKRSAHWVRFEGDVDGAAARCRSIAADIIGRSGGSCTSQQLYDDGLLQDSIEQGYLSVLAGAYRTFLDVLKDDLPFSEGTWRLT